MVSFLALVRNSYYVPGISDKTDAKKEEFVRAGLGSHGSAERNPVTSSPRPRRQQSCQALHCPLKRGNSTIRILARSLSARENS